MPTVGQLINMYELVKSCIDLVKDDLEGVCDEATPGSNNCLDCFQKQYFDENPISYDCNNKINIYIARFFPVHVKENSEALNLFPDDLKKQLMQKNAINIMSIGGGPGSDSYAVKKFLINCENQGYITSKKDIYLLRVDQEESWNDIAGKVNSIVSDTKNLIFDARRKNIDITNSEDWGESSKKYHIFTISYFLSELTNIEQVKTVAKFINKFSSKKISFLFINDRNDGKVDTFKKILFDNISCNESYETEDNTKCHCGYFYDDDDRDLILPKLNTNSIRFFKVLNI